MEPTLSLIHKEPTVPPLPVISGVTRTALNYLDDNGNTATNVIHIFSAMSPPDVADLIEASIPTTGSAMWGPMSSNTRLNSLDLLPLDGSTATYNRVVAPEAWVYGQGGGAPILAVAALVKVQTPVRGRRTQGRIFIPFVGEGVYSSGRIDATPVEDCTNGWNEFQANLIDGLATIGVASYRNRDFVEATTFTCLDKCATQRRRQSRLI